MPTNSVPFFHYIKRKDGIVQKYHTKHRVLGKQYRQLPRTRAFERKFGKRIRVYEKRKAEPVKTMWRCTLTCGLYKSGQRKTLGKWVPEKKTVWAWAVTKEEAEKLAREEMDRIASEYSGELWDDWHSPSMACEQVEYEENLIGMVKVGQ